jgi:hypothetical protein
MPASEQTTVDSGQVTEAAAPEVVAPPEIEQASAPHLRLVGGTAVDGFVAQQPPEPEMPKKHIPMHLQPRIGGSAPPRIW